MRRRFLFHQRMHTWNLSLLVLGLSLPCLFSVSLAQAPPITPSGLNTQVSEPIAVGGQTQYNITGGTRPGGGANLFHSFGDFGVPTNNIANFQNTPVNGVLPTTSNILARVTGGDMSNIFGSIKTTDFGNANLFLMNPAGFLFGPNATVNVGGMVAFTSADYLKLMDNARFNAIPNAAADALLTAVPVAAFGFLGPNAASIAIQGGTLEVANGETLSFIGGPRVFTTDTGVTVPSGVSMSGGSLSAPNGLIYMATVTSPREVPVPTLSDAQLGSLGSPSSGPAVIRIRSGEFVMDHAFLTATNTSDAVQSAIEVNVQGAMELRNASSISTKASDSGHGSAEAINILADSLTLENRSTVDTSAAPGTTGRGGDIGIQVRQASLSGFSTIRSETAGKGDAGAISIQGNDGISLVDSSIVSTATPISRSTARGGLIRLHAPSIEAKGSHILSSTDGLGNAGNILIETQNLTVTGVGNLNDFSTISARTEGPGQAGQIMIHGTDGPGSHAQDIILSDNSQIVSETVSSALAVGGNAGSVTIDTARLSLGEFSGISTASSGTAPSGLSPGHAGNITVNATDSVTVFSSQIITSTGTSGSGGSITINTGTLKLTGGGQLTSSSFLSAPAGTVTVQGVQGQGSTANSVVISGQGEFGTTSGIFTDTQGTGKGGNIFVNANSVTLQNGGTLSAKTSGSATTASGGLITVNATDHVIMTGDASITASSTGHGNAGNILINAGRAFVATNSKSAVTTQADTASGGNITVLATDMVQLTNSHISASVADGPGGGGNISIDPQSVILQNSQILAQAAQGQGGAITITTNLFLPDANSIVNADSGSGLNGTVTIQSPNAPASGKIQPLGNQPLQATSLLNQRCAALAGGEFSSFTIAGRDSLPTEPGGWLSSPLALAISESDGSTITNTGLRAGRDEPMRESSLLSLRQISPPGFLTQAFAVDWSAGCTS